MKPLQYEIVVTCYNWAKSELKYSAKDGAGAKAHAIQLSKENINYFVWDKDPDEIKFVKWRRVGKIMWKQFFTTTRESRTREELHVKGMEIHRRATMYDELVEALRNMVYDSDGNELHSAGSDRIGKAKAVLNKADNK